MPEPVLAKVLGNVSDAPQGGPPLVEINLDGDTLQMNTRLDIKFIAAAYTVVAGDSGKVLVVTAAVTITLPAVTAALKGVHLWVFNKTDTNLTIAATANEMVTFNDVDADAIAFSTTSEKAGAAVHLVCDGLAWLVFSMVEETQTMTVTT